MGYGTGAMIRRLIALAVVPIFTRNLTQEDYGIVATAAVAVALFSQVLGLGLKGAITRQYFHVRDDASTLYDYLYSVLGGAALLGSAGAAFFIGILVLNPSAEWFGIPSYPHWLIVVATAFSVMLLQMILSIHRAEEHVRQYVTFDVGHYAMAGALAVAAVLLAKWDAVGKLLGDLGGAVLVLVAGVAGSKIVLKSLKSGTFRRGALKKSLLFGIPLVPHLMATWVLTGIDRFFLAEQISVAEAGVYDIGCKTAAGVSLLVTAANLAWGPIVYDIARERDDATETLGTLYSVMFALICAATLATCLYGDVLVYILGGEVYERATSIVVPVALGYLFYGVYTFANQAFYFGNATKLLPVLTIGAAALNIVLNIVLIPVYGMSGAAYATLISYFGLAVVTHLWAQRFIGFRMDWVVLATSVTGLGLLLGVFTAATPTLRAATSELGLQMVRGGGILVFGVMVAGAVRMSTGQSIATVVWMLIAAKRS